MVRTIFWTKYILFTCTVPGIYFLNLWNPVEGRELVKILLAAGADPTAQDTQNAQTALHTAAMANDVELVRVR